MSIKELERPIANSNANSFIPGLIASSTLAIASITSPWIADDLPTYIQNIPSELVKSFFASEGHELDIQKLVYSIRNYGTYEHNWDSYEGKPASEKTIQDAINFIKKLPGSIKLPFTGLSGDGEINLFWDAEGIFIDIGFIGDNKFSYYAKDANGKEYSGNYILISSTLPPDLIKLITTIKL